MLFPVLICKNPSCSRTMLLPEPMRLDTSQHQPWWPTDGKPRNFLCPVCRHAFEYSAQDVRENPLDGMVQDRGQTGGNVVLIETRCGETGCATPLQLRTLMQSNADIDQRARAILERWTAHGVRCPADHVTNAQFLPVQGRLLNFHAELDKDWKLSDF
jgi:hypothetical protein